MRRVGDPAESAPREQRRSDPRRYTVALHKLHDWHLASEEPRIVLAQLKTRYRNFAETGGRIQPAPDDAYVRHLFSVLEFTRQRKAQFCLFPEYAWPLSQVEPLFRWLHEYREEQRAYIIPFEHLRVVQYQQLLAITLLNNGWIDKKTVDEELNELEDFAEHRDDVVNGTLTVVQSRARLVTVPQRKLRPAALEETLTHKWKMVSGKRVKIIEVAARRNTRDDSPPLFRFASLVCFDVITRDEEFGERPRDVVCARDLNVLFVPECNPQPLHGFYLKSEVAMYQWPRWAQHPPTIVFANAAAGSSLELPPNMVPSFGFSRVVGRLGEINATGGCVGFNGYASCERLAALHEIKERGVVVPDKRIHTIIVRPEQSVVTIHLPNALTGPAEDASVHRSGTEIDVVRPVSPDTSAWLRVRDLSTDSGSAADIDVPAHLKGIELTSGVQAYEITLADAMHTRAEPLRLAGSPGVGKSALVASTLQRYRGPHDRIVWINLDEVEPGEEPLVDAILAKLAVKVTRWVDRTTGTRVERAERKFETLRQELRQIPTAIVLDNREAWEDAELPRRVLELHGWKTVILIVSKQLREAEQQLAPNELTVEPLRDDDFAQLVTAHARPHTASKTFISMLMKASKNAAVGAVWGGSLYRVSPSASQRLTMSLETQANPTLETIFTWIYGELNDEDRSILGILCEVTSPIPSSDVALVLEKEEPEIDTSIGKLLTLQLIESPSPVDGEKLYTAHPFVRQLWRHAPEKDRKLSGQSAIDWAFLISDKYGQDRNFASIPRMRLRWPGMAAVLRRLARGSGDRLVKRTYLRIWRRCDGFLWTYGLWRERIDLARLAVDFARDRDPDEPWKVIEELAQYEAHALYDSIAKTQWHIDGTRSPADDSIEDALTIAYELDDKALLARIYWYRARLLRHTHNLDDAAEAAKKAIGLAKEARKPYTVALAWNALANIFATQGERTLAGKHYRRAFKKIEDYRDEWAEELRAILERNEGRLDLQSGKLEQALQKLERAFEAFGNLHSLIQQAECAVYHAEALIVAGDTDDAARELTWAKSVMLHLGSAVFDELVETAEDRLKNATQP